jgi:hypothetical protein
VSWNGLAIGALARTAAAIEAKDPEGAKVYMEAAVKAAKFVQKELWDDEKGVLRRVYREGRGDVEGFADDYAFLVSGLLDLYEGTFDDEWLAWADKLQSKIFSLPQQVIPVQSDMLFPYNSALTHANRDAKHYLLGSHFSRLLLHLRRCARSDPATQRRHGQRRTLHKRDIRLKLESSL